MSEIEIYECECCGAEDDTDCDCGVECEECGQCAVHCECEDDY